MDLNSPEFYTLAFVVAMALVALLMGRNEKNPPSTHIVPLAVTPDDDGDSENLLTLEPADGGGVMLRRTGLFLGPEETIHLVITIQEDKCNIVEKKGLKRRGAIGEPVKGEAKLKCLRPGGKYSIRYESQLTSTWASFAFDTMHDEFKRVELKY